MTPLLYSFLLADSPSSGSAVQTMLYAAGTNTSIGCPEVRSPMDAVSVHTLEWFCRGCEDEASDVSEITYFIMNYVSSTCIVFCIVRHNRNVEMK